MPNSSSWTLGAVFYRSILALALGSAPVGAASVTSLSLSLGQKIDAPRWMFDPTLKVKSGGPLVSEMIDGKKALLAKDRVKCLGAFQRAYALGKALGPWILYNHLQCALIRNKNGSASVEALQSALAKADQQPRWMLYGPAVGLLRGSYTAALLALADQQVKTDRRTAWSTLDRLQQVKGWLPGEERANLYHWAGELAFIEQNLLAAQDFLTRSLGEKDSADVRARVESIRSSLLGKSRDVPLVPPPRKEVVNEDLGISDEERDIYNRMTSAYQTQDYVSVIEDGVELLTKFPGSRRSLEAADRVLDVYLGLANRTEEKFRHVRDAAVKEMQKADATRLARWANVAYNRGVYADAQGFAERAITKYGGQPESIKMILLAAKGALAAGDDEGARQHLGEVLKYAGGTAESAEAAFRLGLLEYRQKHYAAAAANFERLLALKIGKDFEYRALYWQWRAQQKIDQSKSAAFANPLLSKYPLSYYALRAKAELNQNVLEFPDEKLNVKAETRLLEGERLAWERFTLLLKAGWFREADRELEAVPEPVSNEERLIRARYLAAAMRYDLAIPMVNKAIDANPEWLQRSMIEVVFPTEYTNFISRAATANGLTAEWILSVIRQESSFRPEAKSPSNAYGVMQLLPATAQEIAKDFKVKDYNTDALLNPEMNIRLGATYLARLTKNFSGNLPLSLAAYNAGPTRIRRWMASRRDLSQLETTNSSSPEAEVWIDELPWEETSNYVKSILRNWLIYRIIGGTKLTLSKPIWMDAKATPR